MPTPRFRPEVGGVQRHVEEVARRLVRLGCTVTVLTTGLERGLPATEELEGVKIRRVRAWPRRRDYYFAPHMWTEIRSEGYDLVHVQSYHTFVAPITMLAAWSARLPYVLTFHGGGHSSGVRNRLRGAQLRALRPMLARADRLIAVARFEVEHYGTSLAIPRDRFAVIPNGADIAPAGRGKGPRELADMRIMSVGRLERYKGHQRVIEALPHILHRRPEAHLLIVGSGPYEQDLRKLAVKLGVGHRVRIEAVPSDQPHEMASRFREAAVVALLSDFETHPLGAIEAVALGCPVVVAATSGLMELVEDGLARGIPRESDPIAVASVLLEEIDRPKNRLPLRLPTWDECASELLKLYQAVLWERACAS